MSSPSIVRAHRAHADDVAGDRHLDRLVLALAHDGELDLGVHRAAHLLDGLIEGQALHLLAVELGDDVVRHDAGLGGGRLVDRGHDLDEAVFHRDFDAEPAEFAAGLHLHVAEALGVHVARMRIEPGEHAVDRSFDQLAVVRLLDIFGAHPLEHVAEQVELPVGVGRGRLGARAENTMRGCIASSVIAAPAAAPRRMSEVLRLSANLFAFASRPPWAGIDGSPVLAKFDVEPVGWTCRLDSGDMGAAPMTATGSPVSTTARFQRRSDPSQRARHDTRRRHSVSRVARRSGTAPHRPPNRRRAMSPGRSCPVWLRKCRVPPREFPSEAPKSRTF